MNNSIVEEVLGTLNPYTANYLDVTYRLARSIVLHSSLEAKKYNDLVMLKYKKLINKHDKTTWRYYKHLNGDYHPVDEHMKVYSLDDRQEIILTKESLKIHIDTLEELRRFGSMYDEVFERYPEQGLLLRTLIAANPNRLPLNEIVKLSEWQIVSYNPKLVENQESDLMMDLQVRIDNYSVKGMITHYDTSSTLFLGAAMAILSGFIYRELLTIRLLNVRTSRTHSYHMLAYFSSHHQLDSVYDYLDDYQRLYLYRNLLYLDSHAGKNQTLDKLIDVFFDRKRMVVTNYEYLQLSELREDKSTNYGFVQRLLNKTNYSFPKDVFDLDALKFKEMFTANGNFEFYEYNGEDVDYRLLNSRNTKVMTKDLEVTINDESNMVRNKLFDVTLDYWAVTTELGYNESLVNLSDPVSGKEIYMSSQEAYKLYQICILRSVGYKDATIPDSVVWSAFVDDYIDPEVSLSTIMKRNDYIEKEIREIFTQRPLYSYTQTRSTFREFVERVYLYELGMNVFLDSESDLYARVDIDKAFDDLHRSYTIKGRHINIKAFLEKFEIEEVYDYSTVNLLMLANAVLDRATDGVLSSNETYRLTQEAVLKVLSKFKSYTTQILNNFQVSDGRLVGTFTTRVHREDYEEHSFILLGDRNNGCHEVTQLNHYDVSSDVTEVVVGDDQTLFANVRDVSGVLLDADLINDFLVSGGTGCVTLDEENSTPDTVLTIDDLHRFNLN